jgi:hypothetical protein
MLRRYGNTCGERDKPTFVHMSVAGASGMIRSILINPFH